MAAHPRAGQPAEPADLVDVARLVTAYYAEHPDPGEPAQQVLFGTSGHRGSAFDRAFNDDHIAATTQAICDYRRGQLHRRSALPRQGHPRAVRAGLRDGARGARRQRRHRAGRPARPLHADARAVARDPAAQRGRAADRHGPRRRHRRHAVAQPAARRRLQVQPARRRPRRQRHHRLGAGPRQRAPARRPARRDAGAARPGPRGGLHAALRLPRGVRRRAAVRAGPRRDPRQRAAHRGRPARRRQRRLLGGDRRAAQARPDRGQPAGRPDVPVHDARLRRQDPDGLLVAERDGVAGHDDEPRRLAVRHRHRQRRRRRPARHRHPGRRPAQPQPLPRGGDRVPVPGPRRLVAPTPPSARRWSARA